MSLKSGKKGAAIRIILLFALLILFSISAYSETYYMANESCNNNWQGNYTHPVCDLHTAFSLMESGDTLIVADGIYTGANNTIDNSHKPLTGSNVSYTRVIAENSGKVIFDGEGTRQLVYISSGTTNDSLQPSYISFEGLIFRNSLGKCVGMVNVNHIKFIECGFSDGVKSDDPTLPEIPFDVRYFDYGLLEDCYVWGGSHYGIRLLDSHDAILRRVVVRNDRANGPYQAGIFIYSSYRVAVQNCIVIDNNQRAFYTGLESYSSFYAFYNCDNNGVLNSHVGESVTYDSNIALNNINFAGFIAENYADANFTFNNNVFWGSDLGFWDRTDRQEKFNHCIFGDQRSTIGWGAAVRTNVTNSIIANSIRTGMELSISDYNAFYNNTQNYINTPVGSNDYSSENGNEVDIFDSSLKYLPRVEEGSNLSGLAKDGGDIGVTILNKVGVDGTLFGETGYNVTTNESLWPFPNEDIIKSHFNSYFYSNATHNVSGNRGFAANGTGLYGGPITLTSYIWEYLGNPCPDDICNYTVQSNITQTNFSTLQDFEDEILWLPDNGQDTKGFGRGWAFTWSGAGDLIEIDDIGANGSNHSLKVTFGSEDCDQIYFRSSDKTTDHMPEANGANRMSFYLRFEDDFPIQPLPFRYDTWQMGTYIHDPDNWSNTYGASDWDDPGIHHYYARLTMEYTGGGWTKYIINTQPDQCNYGGSTVPPLIPHFFDQFGRFYFHFSTEAGGPVPDKPYTVWIDEIQFYYDDGSVGGEVHTGGVDDEGFDGQWFPDQSSYNDADLNTDNIINTSEVRYYISEWIGGSATIGDLTSVIEIWKNGGSY